VQKEKPVDLTVKYKRREVEDLLKRKFFVVPSFEIYGGVAGFFDFGPLGSALKQAVGGQMENSLRSRRRHVGSDYHKPNRSRCSETSGHVDKFSDFLWSKMSKQVLLDALIN
jgi:glycyl-tRNA synthetase